MSLEEVQAKMNFRYARMARRAEKLKKLFGRPAVIPKTGFGGEFLHEKMNHSGVGIKGGHPKVGFMAGQVT